MLLTANGTSFSLVQGEGIKILGGTQSLLQVSCCFPPFFPPFFSFLSKGTSLVVYLVYYLYVYFVSNAFINYYTTFF